MPGRPDVRLSVFSNVNLDLLLRDLRKDHDVFSPDGYDTWISCALKPDKRLLTFNPECAILWLDGSALVERCESQDAMQAVLSQTADFAAFLTERHPNSIVAVSTIDIQRKRIRSGDDAPLEHAIEAFWDGLLTELCLKHANIHRFELREIIRENGAGNIYSDKMWYMGSIPYSLKSLPIFRRAVGEFLEQFRTVRKKVLVLDLDNTLWGGVIGEDGALGITLGETLLGAVYRDAQKRIKEIAERGVLLAIASKNNPDMVERVFEKNPHMVLKAEDFVCIQAGWNPKHEMILAIAAQLNLGLDAFVFLDDNAVERETVRANLPEVTVADFPVDIAKLPGVIRDLYRRHFWIWRETAEDRQKTEQYHQEFHRKQEMASAVSIDYYLLSLNIEISLDIVRPETMERVVQLINKTNQFNVCTVRLTRLQVEQFAQGEGQDVITAHVKDRYGDSGLVSVVMIHREGERATIDNILMSCRVMGRQIEDAIHYGVERRLLAQGIHRIDARYIPTLKNKPVAALWDRLGYEVLASEGGGKAYWKTLDPNAPKPLLSVAWLE
jgi:FkbH-like protein